ncbi:uncharacterized protein [Epargyreus clarus]|uniref:uncharacterized protein n=1 Tax=Epargyreus clarus TaxID=520877 RepID=UPI003C2F9C96
MSYSNPIYLSGGSNRKDLKLGNQQYTSTNCIAFCFYEQKQYIKLLSFTDISTRNSILEDLVQGLIDSVRDVILNGSGDIPVLDPFELDELHLDGDMVDIVDLPDSHVTLKDINVLNLGKFEIDDMSVSIASIIPQRYRITLDGRIPSLDVQTGAYDMLVNIFGGVVFGTGEMKLNVINPRIYGHIVVGMRISISGISLTITSSQLNFSLEAFKPEITGMFGNQAASDFVSTFLSILIPEMTEYFKEDISDIINTVVIEVGNQLLNDMDVGSILPLDSGILSKYSGMQPNPDVIVNSKDMRENKFVRLNEFGR